MWGVIDTWLQFPNNLDIDIMRHQNKKEVVMLQFPNNLDIDIIKMYVDSR